VKLSLKRKENKMKRTSVLTIAIAILTVVPCVTKGHHYGHSSSRHRVRWSPYASGLVSGDLRYNPYARKYGQSGLVPYWVRYSPYAFSNKHPSGLVNDYASTTTSKSSIYYSPNGYGYRYSGRRYAYDCSNNASQTQHGHKAKLEARKEWIRIRATT
jgi:hypothetical protein